MKLPSGATPASRLREVRADGDVVAAAEKLEKVRTPDSGSDIACAHALAVLTGPASVNHAIKRPVVWFLQLARALNCLRLALRTHAY